jgi:hypothetical protein
MIEIRDNSCIEVPPIGIEINEDAHQGYDKLDEEKRTKIIEYFGSRIFQVPVDRKVSDEELKEIVDKTSEDILTTLKELVIDYNPEITEERLCEIVEKNNIDKEFLAMFIRGSGKSPYEQFKFCNKDVAEYLGYSDNNIRRDFPKDMKKVNPSNYIVKTRAELKAEFIVKNRCVKIDTSVLIEEYDLNTNGGQNQKFYFLNRVGFYQICMASTRPKARMVREYFVEVYEAVMNYVCRSRVRNIGRLMEVKKSIPFVEERIDKRVNDRVKTYTSFKNKSQMEDQAQLLEKMRGKIDELVSQKVQDDRIITDMDKKLKSITLSKYELLDQKKQDDRIITENNARLSESKLSQYKAEEKLDELKKKNDECDLVVKELNNKYNKIVPEYKLLLKDFQKNKVLLIYKTKKLQYQSDKNLEKDNQISKLMKLLDDKSGPQKLIRKIKPVTIVNPKSATKKLIRKIKPVVTQSITDLFVGTDTTKSQSAVKKLIPKIKSVVIDDVKESITELVVDPVEQKEVVVNVKEVKYNKDDLNVKTMNELKDICRHSGVGGYSGKNKSILIDWMLTNEKIIVK